jgi:hypothetical protein
MSTAKNPQILALNELGQSVWYDNLSRDVLRSGELKNLIVWVKSNAGLGSFYRSQHELIFVYKNGIDNLTLRLNSESFLLNLCKKLDVKLMNEHIPLII